MNYWFYKIAVKNFGEAIAIACATQKRALMSAWWRGAKKRWKKWRGQHGPNGRLETSVDWSVRPSRGDVRWRGANKRWKKWRRRHDAQIHHAALDKTRAAFGPVDVLVNNAGINVTERSISDTSIEQWRELLEVNLSSAFVFTKAVLPEMKTRGDGLIINLASRAGMFPSLMAGVGYSASKIGMEALNEVTNQEGNPHGVRACLFNPGAGNTPIIDRRPKEDSAWNKR